MSNPILVVEDNQDISLLLTLLLESVGYQVETVSNGKDALTKIEKIRPQLMLIDIMMPEISGLEISRIIKEKLERKDLPILLVSAVDRLQNEQFLDSQADDIIYKPFDLDDLISKVYQLTDSYHSMGSIEQTAIAT